MQGIELEREVLRQLPITIADLFEVPATTVAITQTAAADAAWDLDLTLDGRQWLVEIKSSSSPGTIAQVARRFRAASQRIAANAAPLLVVPYMTPAGAKAAAAEGLNWLDLSGNANLRAAQMYVRVEGRPNSYRRRGRPTSPFAPKASRITRIMLLDPRRWWRQTAIAAEAHLDDGYVSRVVRRLEADGLLDRQGTEFRPSDPGGLLDAWADDYKFARHDALLGHMSGSGIELAETLHHRLEAGGIQHAFTGLPAAWQLAQVAAFRLVSVYVEGDPRNVAEAVDLRVESSGANVQLLGPDDPGVFAGASSAKPYPYVSAPQTYLDLLHLPERSREAADHLRGHGLGWTERER